MTSKNNYQCRKCGNIHSTQPDKCPCGGQKFRIIYQDKTQSEVDRCDYCGSPGKIKRWERDLNLCSECADLLGYGTSIWEA